MTRLTFIGGAMLALSAPAWGATPVPFVPHQALYELSLQKARGSTTLEGARGRILYNFTGSVCEGYTSDFRQVSQLDSGEGKTTLSDLRSTTWEDGQGKSFRFKIDTRTDDAEASSIDGTAERDGGKINVRLKKPATKNFTIDGATVFPTEQMHRIVEAARSGKSVLELLVYDGSDTGEKVYSTLTVIGKAITSERSPASPDPASESDRMKTMTRWPVTVSYFDRSAKAADGEQTPVYAMSFELYENGVSRALVLDYNAFVIAGAVTKFDIKESKPCK